MTRRRRVTILLAALGGFVAFLWLQRGPLPLRHELTRFLWQEGIPGVALAIHSADGAEETLEIGRLSDGETPVRRDTLFSIASLSKPLTAAAVRRLIAFGRVRLDDRLSDVLSGVRFDSDSRLGMVTIGQLLQHTGGMSGNGIDDPLFRAGRVVGCDAAIQGEVQRAGWPAGERSVYSNVGYCLLGTALAHAAQEPYAAAVADLLHFDPNDSRLVYGFPRTREDNGASAHASLPTDSYTLLGAAGGWFSDARTLARVLAEDVADATRFDQIALPAPAVAGRGWHYGLGWRVPHEYPGMLSHFGFLPGTFAIAVAVRGRGVSVALFSGSPEDPESAARKLVPVLSNALRVERSWH